MSDFKIYEQDFHYLATWLRGRRKYDYKDKENGITIAVINKYKDSKDAFVGSILSTEDEQCTFISLLYGTLEFEYISKLLPPYTKEEIEGYEKKQCFVFPTLLRHYLLNISREFVSTSYAVEMKFDDDLGENTMLTKEHIKNRYLGERFADDEGTICAEDGTLWIGDAGCAFDSYAVVKGTGAGYVLCHNDYDYTIKTFWEYLRKPNTFCRRVKR